MSSHPLVTVCMPTYGRPELLEEAIECFHRQTWPNKRLIIGNDYADQVIAYDHPQVLVINRASRFPTLGEKRNWLMGYAGETFIAHWDDDDIYLENHIETVMGLIPAFRAHAARQFHCWFETGRHKYRMLFASYMHTVIADRHVLREVGDYSALNMNEDAELMKRLLEAGMLTGPPQRLHEPTFIQRLGSRRHMTDFGDGCMEGMEADAKAQGISGTIELHPTWRDDYAGKAAASWQAVCQAMKP